MTGIGPWRVICQVYALKSYELILFLTNSSPTSLKMFLASHQYAFTSIYATLNLKPILAPAQSTF